MKKRLLTLFLLPVFAGISQIPAYYSSVDFSLTEMALKAELADLITSTHTSPTTYGEVWAVLQAADLDPTDSDLVLLVYGYDDEDGVVKNDRSRDKNNYGGSAGQWNREHVFPKSLGSPDLGTTGPGSDPHNLRASDVQFNGDRANRMYANGSGNAGNVGSNWYPGDEWKGDAARIIMYMYLRYGTRCTPSAVAVGSTNAIDPGMIDLLLDWNASDDVSTFEINRNNAIYAVIGNRNPFIDNPHIANRIWHGAEATDTWGNLEIDNQLQLANVQLYPNPVNGDYFYLNSTTTFQLDDVSVYDLQGQQLLHCGSTVLNTPIQINASNWAAGTYIIQIQVGNTVETRKLSIQ